TTEYLEQMMKENTLPDRKDFLKRILTACIEDNAILRDSINYSRKLLKYVKNGLNEIEKSQASYMDLAISIQGYLSRSSTTLQKLALIPEERSQVLQNQKMRHSKNARNLFQLISLYDRLQQLSHI